MLSLLCRNESGRYHTNCKASAVFRLFVRKKGENSSIGGL